MATNLVTISSGAPQTEAFSKGHSETLSTVQYPSPPAGASSNKVSKADPNSTADSVTRTSEEYLVSTTTACYSEYLQE